MRSSAIYPARLCVLQSLLAVLHKGRNLDQAMLEVCDQHAAAKDKPFIQALSYGVLRDYFWLKAASESFLTKPLKAKDADVGLLLCIGIYEIKVQKTPSYAVINEVVKLCNFLKKPWATKLVNAILRGYLRQSESFSLINPSLDSQYNHPSWLIKQLQNDWPEHWQAILAANNEHPPMHLRVNLTKTTRDDYLLALNKAEISAHLSTFVPSAITLDSPVDISQLPSFAEGYASVQDLGAQMAAYLLDLSPQHRVLDACAAPGGKTNHMLELFPDMTLTALDAHPLRIQRVRQNLARLTQKATLLQADANAVPTWWEGKAFDRILLDVPCSATGVIRRHPDIKHLRREGDILALQREQLTLLKNVWQTLMPGGILVYVTCSLLQAENDAVIDAFVTKCQHAEVVEVSMDEAHLTQYGIQFLPEKLSTDGFYYAKLRKALGAI